MKNTPKPLNYHQKAVRLAKSMAGKARREKIELGHTLCQYYAMVLAQGHKKIKLR